MERLKELFSKYIVYVFVLLIIIVLVLLILPVNNNEPKEVGSTLTLTLKGNSNVSIPKGQAYRENGYIAYDTKDGDLTSRVVVNGSVNTDVVGTYIVRYSVTNSTGKTAEALRTINVVADITDVKITVDYSPRDLTNGDVTITLSVSGGGYDFALIPDGEIVKSNNLSYNVSENGEYIFSVKRKDGSIIEEVVEIENIDKKKPTGSCKNVVSDDKTVITVTASDESGINSYSYNFNNKKYDSDSTTYTVNEQVQNVSVTVYDKVNNYQIISCVKIDDTWPVLGNQNLTTHSTKNYNQSLRYEGRMNYIIYYPEDLDLTKKNPLVVYLHEAGGFGSSISATIDPNKKIFTNNMRTGRFQQKAIFLAPQCRSKGNGWTDCFSDLKGLIDLIVEKYNIDTKKISMTGHSLGGKGVFDFIVAYPGFLSAVAALAPSDINKDYTKMLDLRIAVFTGTSDGNHQRNEPDCAYLKSMGVNIKYYALKDIGHTHIQHEIYLRSNAIDWLIAQSR